MSGLLNSLALTAKIAVSAGVVSMAAPEASPGKLNTPSGGFIVNSSFCYKAAALRRGFF